MDATSIWSKLGEFANSLPCGIEKWNKVWGAPIFTGTVFMLCYGLAGLLMLGVGKRVLGRERILWRIGAFLCFFQTINTHLDLHAFVVTYGRCLAHAQGWYAARHSVQYGLLVTAIVVMVSLILIAMIYFRRNLAQNFLLIIGVSIFLGLTVAKGINYHDLEAYYAGNYGPFRGADLIELSGIFIAAAAAWLRRRRLMRAESGQAT